MKGRIYTTDFGYLVWFPDGTRHGIRKRFKAHEHAKAERFLNGLRFKFDEGTLDPRDYKADNPLGFANLVERFLSTKSYLAGVKKYEQRLRFAVERWGNSNIKTIGYGHIEDLINELRASGKSDKYLKDINDCLRMFWRWLLKRKEIRYDEMPEFPRIKGISPLRKILTKQQQVDVLSELYRISWGFNPHIYLGVLFLATYINLRPNELRNIKEKHIDYNNRTILIPHPKEGQPKYVYLIEDDVNILKSFPKSFPEMYVFRHDRGNGGAPPGSQFGRDYLQRWWDNACRNIGVFGVSLYPGTRHSSTVALRNTDSVETVKQATGHKANKAFERYLQVTGDQMRSLYAKTRPDNKLIRFEDVAKKSK